MLDTTLPPAAQSAALEAEPRVPVRRLVAVVAALALLGFAVAASVVEPTTAVWVLAASVIITAVSHLFDRLEHH